VVGERSVTVDLTENHVPFSFARVIGTSEGTVSAHAKAELMYLTGLPQVAPVAIPYLDPDGFKVHVGRSTSHEVTAFDLNKTGAGLYQGSTAQRIWARSSDDYLLWLTAQDGNGEELMAPLVVGSVFVPDSDDPIRRVELSRPDAGAASETVEVTVFTEGLPAQIDTVPIVWRLNSGSRHRVTLHSEGTGTGVFSGAFTVAPSSWINGMAMVSIETTWAYEWDHNWGDWWWHYHDWWDHHWFWHEDSPLAMFAMFDQTQSIRYFKQSGYTGGDEGQSTISAQVGTRVYDLNGGEITVSSKDLFFQSSFGPTGWGDMLAVAGFPDEVKVALQEEQRDPSWTLFCDTNGNDQADIGEWVPVNSTVRGTAGWGAGLSQAMGKVVFVALVDPGYEAATAPQFPYHHHHYDWWWGGYYSNWWNTHWFHHHHGPYPATPNYPTDLQITHLGAFQVDSVSLDGASDFTMTGHFTRYLGTGQWTNVKPDGVYVETAVLTE
jgi:hypothetical protein